MLLDAGGLLSAGICEGIAAANCLTHFRKQLADGQTDTKHL